jgi:hypothetical protein
LNISTGSNGGLPPLPRALRCSAATQRAAENLKINDSCQTFKLITRCAQRLVSVREVKRSPTALTSSLPLSHRGSELAQAVKIQSFRTVYFVHRLRAGEWPVLAQATVQSPIAK